MRIKKKKVKHLFTTSCYRLTLLPAMSPRDIARITYLDIVALSHLKYATFEMAFGVHARG